jgi:hypothetical protein
MNLNQFKAMLAQATSLDELKALLGQATGPSQVEAFSVNQFCVEHNFCRASYYKLKAAGKGPKELRVGKRVLITREAAAEWRRAMVADAGTRSEPEAA